MRSRKETTDQLQLHRTPEVDEPEHIESVFDLTQEKVERLTRVRPKLLGITCGRTDCTKGLHCFDSVKSKLRFERGRCQQCGIDLIDWDQMWLRDTRDVDKKFEFLKKEWIRHFFFHVPVSPRIEEYARQHGLKGLAEILEKQLRQGKMLRFMPAFDRKQTKMLNGTIIHWARHAVGCCCRQCMSYWHNVPLDQELSNEEVQYFKELALMYIVERIPGLKESKLGPASASPRAAARAN